jgi:hypothetical protein
MVSLVRIQTSEMARGTLVSNTMGEWPEFLGRRAGWVLH